MNFSENIKTVAVIHVTGILSGKNEALGLKC
jgi:hypothetical protein